VKVLLNAKAEVNVKDKVSEWHCPTY
jgi:hypothetical protein